MIDIFMNMYIQKNNTALTGGFILMIKQSSKVNVNDTSNVANQILVQRAM